ncbi:MAG: type II toxin-antitoxin system HicA family toxin [Prevotella sp.]|nr:type II toxin-antitoxin system HicA family toxin [Prevotella sp.]
MKYSELHRRFVKAGWTFDHAEGSHYFYTKNGVMTEPIPFHGSHEIGKGLANKLIRKYNV